MVALRRCQAYLDANHPLGVSVKPDIVPVHLTKPDAVHPGSKTHLKWSYCVQLQGLEDKK